MLFYGHSDNVICRDSKQDNECIHGNIVTIYYLIIITYFR